MSAETAFRPSSEYAARMSRVDRSARSGESASLQLPPSVVASSAQAFVGYVNTTFQPGNTLFQNPVSTSNYIDAIFTTGHIDDTISLWNSTSRTYDQVAMFNGVQWVNANPPPYSGPAGLFLLGDKMPIPDTGNDIFLNIFGRNPDPGEQVIKSFDPIHLSPNPAVYTYDGNGIWDYNGVQGITPTLAAAEAAFFNILVPEPGPIAHASVGAGLLALRRRSRP